MEASTTFELDHVILWTAAGAPEGNLLSAAGLQETTRNRHQGQGTANRRFLFANAFLELVWVEDPGKAQSELSRRLRLCERWSCRDRQASPFGICVRPAELNQMAMPFSSWEYRPSYLPAPLALHIGTNSEDWSEPLLVYMPFGRPRGSPSAGTVSRVQISMRTDKPLSAELQQVLASCPWLHLVRSDEDFLELSLEDGPSGFRNDFRPELPLVIRSPDRSM